MDDRALDGDDTIGRVIGLAGPRPMPSPERVARVRGAVHAAWRTSRRRRRARHLAMVAAAGLAAVAVAWLWPQTIREPLIVAHLESLTGAVEVEGDVGWRPMDRGTPFVVGSRFRTAAGARAGLRLRAGHTLRLDAGTTVRWNGPASLTLEQGTCYLASDPAASTGSLVVETRWGHVREIGTQFEVRAEPAGLRVRVREGRVTVVREGREHPVASGFELRVGATGVSTRPIAVHGSEWAWVASAGPGFPIEGRHLGAFLGWVSRENGWRLRFADAESERLAGTIVLHGTIEGLSAEDALAVVLPTTGLPYRLADGVLTVGGGPGTKR
jgi:ferric-dicitrate binding protein FerR (iron transport regulator)